MNDRFRAQPSGGSAGFDRWKGHGGPVSPIKQVHAIALSREQLRAAGIAELR